MIDLKALLDRQAKWQKSRRDLPWPEKVRMAAILRDSVAQLRRSALTSRAPTSESVPPKSEK